LKFLSNIAVLLSVTEEKAVAEAKTGIRSYFINRQLSELPNK